MPEPKPTESDAVPSPGVANVPPPAPPSQPDPNAPPPDPAPAKPPEPPKPTFKSLEDDLADFAKSQEEPPPPAKPAKKPAEPAKPGEPPAEPSKPSETPPEGDDDFLGLPKAKPKEKPPEGQEPPKEEPPTGPMKAPELRAAYAKVKERAAELEKELETLKSGAKPVDEVEKKAYVSEIETLKKQLEEADKVIRATAYERSQEYHDKYEKPFVTAWNQGVEQIKRFNVQDQEGNVRKGTQEDFATIMQIPDDEQAATMAQEMFGANAFYVLSRRQDIIKLHGQRVQALEEFQAGLSERQKAEQAKMKEQSEAQEAKRIEVQAMWKRVNEEAVKKHPDLFAPVDGDDEGNELLAKGFQFADMAFSAAQDMPQEKRVRMHAALRNRAAAFSRLVHQLRGKDAEIETLKAELEEIRGSTPGGGQEGREHGQNRGRPTADEEIEAAAMRTTPR